MGLPEPDNELYAVVKAISNPWPPDDEEAARQLGQTWRTAGQAASQAGTQLESSRQTVVSAWRDQAGTAFGTKLTGGVQSLRQISDGAVQLAGTAETYAQELLDAKTTITSVIAQHLTLFLQLAVAPGGAVAQTQLATSIAGQLQAMIAAKAAALSGAAPVAVTSVPTPAQLPPPGTSPGQVRDWWSKLENGQRDWAIEHQSAAIGNLNGIPAAARNLANRRSLLLALTSDDPDVRANAQAASEALGAAEGRYRDSGVPVQLWAFDPHALGQDGRVAISVGDLDTAQNVAVLTPGLTTDGRSVGGGVYEAGNVYDAAIASRSESTAVLDWIGYDAPSGWDSGGVAAANMADDGARLLAADVNSLRAARAGDGQPHITAVGHSYGSTTTAIAASKYGLQANDVVLVGSPGAGPGNEVDSQLRTWDGQGYTSADGHVYAGSSSDDPVAGIGATSFGTLGYDPSGADFDAIRFQAETEKTGIEAHSSYYDAGGESVTNIGKVVAGHGAEVTQAPHAGVGSYWSLEGRVREDPEELRPPTPLPGR